MTKLLAPEEVFHDASNPFIVLSTPADSPDDLKAQLSRYIMEKREDARYARVYLTARNSGEPDVGMTHTCHDALALDFYTGAMRVVVTFWKTLSESNHDFI
jgi:hypothetical protein